MLFLVCVLSLIPASLSLPAIDPSIDADIHVDRFREHVKKESERLWVDMDYNKNGQYDRDDLETLITDYDSNGDRKITDAEFEFHFDMQEPTLAIVAKALFAEYDHDQDGVIDSTDLDNVHDRMDHLRKDGVIDHEEFVTYYTELLTVLYILQIQSGQTPEIN